MTFEYILIGLAIFHIGLALLNTIAINESFFLSPSKKFQFHLLNWFIPLLGPAIVYDKYKAPPKHNKLSDSVDNTGTYYANSDSGGSDSGGGGD